MYASVAAVAEMDTPTAIPNVAVSAMSARLDNPAPYGWETYEVVAGDTISELAYARRSTVAAIAERNELVNPRLIGVGQRLSLPRTVPLTTKKPRALEPYFVRTGETLWDVADAHDTTVSQLIKANRLRHTTIVAGQRLLVPAGGAPLAVADDYFYQSAADDDEAPNQWVATVTPLIPSHQIPSRAEAKALIRETAVGYGVDPKLALAIGWQESGWNQAAHSQADAHGIMQVIPSSMEWASSLVGRVLDVSNAADNVTAGVVILRALSRATSDIDVVIASYYQGYYSVTTRGMFDDTKQYVAAVKALARTM